MIPPSGRRMTRGVPLDFLEFEIDVTVVGTWSVIVASEAAWNSLPESSRPKCVAQVNGVMLGLVPPTDVSASPKLRVFAPS